MLQNTDLHRVSYFFTCHCIYWFLFMQMNKEMWKLISWMLNVWSKTEVWVEVHQNLMRSFSEFVIWEKGSINELTLHLAASAGYQDDPQSAEAWFKIALAKGQQPRNHILFYYVWVFCEVKGQNLSTFQDNAHSLLTVEGSTGEEDISVDFTVFNIFSLCSNKYTEKG